MKPTQDIAAAPAGVAVCCDVAGYGVVRATAEQLPALRQKPGPVVGEPLPAAFLKHADEQTVAGLAAVFQAIHRHGLAETRFTDWGVLAAPRFLGRVTMAAALHKFAVEGAWGISPHLIPHRSLHSISGTVSQALRIHGPNFGVGGGPGGAAEALLAASALLTTGEVPGVWVVLSGWDPEPVPAPSAALSTAPVCGAVALALVPTRTTWRGPRLNLVPRWHSEPQPLRNGHTPAFNLFSLETLLTTLTSVEAARTTVIWPLDHGGWMELQWSNADAPLPTEPAVPSDRALFRHSMGAGVETQG